MLMFELELVVVTVATDVTDGFVRFNRSVNVYGFKLEILGLNQQWTGGDVTRLPGGGQKVNLLKKYLQNFRDRDDMIILFTDRFAIPFVCLLSSDNNFVNNNKPQLRCHTQREAGRSCAAFPVLQQQCCLFVRKVLLARQEPGQRVS